MVFINNINNDNSLESLEIGENPQGPLERWENFLELFNQYNIMKEKRLNTDSMVDFTVFEYNNKTLRVTPKGSIL